MKKILSLLMVLGIVFSNAQDKVLKVSTGITLPFGEYESTTIDNVSGFAQPGYYIGIEALNYRSDWFGLGGNLQIARHGFDNAAFEENAASTFTELESISISTSSYTSISMHVSPYFRIKPTPFIESTLHLGIGFNHLIRPETDLDFSGPITSASYHIENSHGAGPSGQVGLGITAEISPKVSLGGQVNYTLSSTRFEYFGWEGTRWALYEDKQKIEMLNVGVSLRVDL